MSYDLCVLLSNLCHMTYLLLACDICHMTDVISFETCVIRHMSCVDYYSTYVIRHGEVFYYDIELFHTFLVMSREII